MADTPDGGLVYDGRDEQPSACASVNHVLRRLLRRAGIDKQDVMPWSVPLSAGVAAYRAHGRLEDAARRLGLSSIDKAAVLLRIDWANEEPADGG